MSNRTQRRANKRSKSPKSIPATQQDVERAKKKGSDDAFNVSVAIILTALLDGGMLTAEQMHPAWERINSLSDSIVKGYVSVGDLIHTLRKEYEIYV